jgi:cell division septum initiation protein DivIVA
VSTNGLDFLTQEIEDPLHPQFTRVLKGFDSEEVQAYVGQMVHRIQSLESALQEAIAQREAAQRRYGQAKEESFRQAASRMGEVMAAADRAAEKLRRETEEEAAGILRDARQQSEQLRREAEGEACRLRQEGEETLRTAHAEAERVMAELGTRREEILTEFGAIRSRVLGIVENLDGAASASAALEVSEPEWTLEDVFEGAPSADPAAANPAASNSSDPGTDDLLQRPEGFDLFIPDLLHDEEP